jgi:hypothetical protein
MERKYKIRLCIVAFLSLVLCVFTIIKANFDSEGFATKVLKSESAISIYGCIKDDYIYVSSSDYFDKYGVLDDGSSSEYIAISKAMRDSGFSEDRESVFMINGASAARVAEMLNERNITISFDNKAFNEFCLR